MIDRRRDPRTSKPYSLGNLLRTRAERHGFLLAVVGTPEGWVMGSNRTATDRAVQKLVAHASQELFKERRERLELEARDMKLVARKVEAEGRAAFVAALMNESAPEVMDDLEAAVRRILNEPAGPAAVAA